MAATNGNDQRIESDRETLQVAAVGAAADEEEQELDALTTEWSAEVITSSQEADVGIAQIFLAVRDQLPRPSWDVIAAGSEETKALWRQWERLRTFRGYLVRRFDSDNYSEKQTGGVYQPRSLRR